MGMQIDDARHQGEAAGVHRGAGCAGVRADGGDASVADGNIGLLWCVSQTVVDGGTANEKIMHDEREKEGWKQQV